MRTALCTASCTPSPCTGTSVGTATGVGSGKGVSNISDEEWERVMNVNVRACLAITRALLPGFRAQKFGRVITISSNVGAIGRGEARGSG